MSSKQHQWQFSTLLQAANQWRHHKRKKQHRISENSLWWGFTRSFHNIMPHAIQQLLHGHYRFSPITTHHFANETRLSWEYPDRLMLHLIWGIIRPVMQKIIPRRSYHLRGGMQLCLRGIESVLPLHG